MTRESSTHHFFKLPRDLGNKIREKTGFFSILHCISLQTPVYALYPVPTIVSAAILLTIRHLNISLPSTPPDCWWGLFDACWEDVWSVCGYIMRLYRVRNEDEKRRVLGMVRKKDVRKWLEEHAPAQVGGGSNN
jgi:hypothetical protein